MHTERADGATWRWVAPLLFCGHFVLLTSLCGWSLGRLALDGFMLPLALLSAETRRIAWLLLPIWLFMLAYFDLLPRLLPLRGEIHVADLYQAEVAWFGVETPTGRISLPEWFDYYEWHWPAVDLICGLVYMLEVPIILPVFAFLYLRDRQRLPLLTWSFLLVNVASMATWVLYPAAPPWYVIRFGLGPAVLNAASSAAGLARVDQILGIELIYQYYSRSVNVFGAMPSAHVAVPTAIACSLIGGDRRWCAGAVIFAGIMAFGAVYFQHHYVLDVLVGVAYGAIAVAVVKLVIEAFDRSAARCG